MPSLKYAKIANRAVYVSSLARLSPIKSARADLINFRSDTYKNGVWVSAAMLLGNPSMLGRMGAFNSMFMLLRQG